MVNFMPKKEKKNIHDGKVNCGYCTSFEGIES